MQPRAMTLMSHLRALGTAALQWLVHQLDGGDTRRRLRIEIPTVNGPVRIEYDSSRKTPKRLQQTQLRAWKNDSFEPKRLDRNSGPGRSVR